MASIEACFRFWISLCPVVLGVQRNVCAHLGNAGAGYGRLLCFSRLPDRAATPAAQHTLARDRLRGWSWAAASDGDRTLAAGLYSTPLSTAHLSRRIGPPEERVGQ